MISSSISSTISWYFLLPLEEVVDVDEVDEEVDDEVECVEWRMEEQRKEHRSF